MATTLTHTAEEFEKVFPEAAILLRMTLQSAIDTYRVESSASEVHELRTKVAELQSKLSRPKNGGNKAVAYDKVAYEETSASAAPSKRTVL